MNSHRYHHNPLTALARRAPSSAKEFIQVLGASVPTKEDLPDDAATIAGAAVGAYLGNSRGHTVLGAVLGASVARNAPHLVKSGHRQAAAVSLAHTGVSALASTMVPKHPGIAFAAAWVLGGWAIHHWNLRGE